MHPPPDSAPGGEGAGFACSDPEQSCLDVASFLGLWGLGCPQLPPEVTLVAVHMQRAGGMLAAVLVLSCICLVGLSFSCAGGWGGVTLG